MELAKGGEALLRRLGDVSAVNVELRRQLEAQSGEISALEESGRAQQQLLRDFERRAGQARQDEALVAEAKVRAEAASHEAQLRTELQEYRDRAQRDREELLEQLRRCDHERGQREGERDEARAQVLELQARLEALMPKSQEMRVQALEMEMGLVRSRFAKEAAARAVAERAGTEARAQQQRLQQQLDRSTGEARQLQRALAEQAEMVAFQQEICDDLQARLAEQKAEAERRLGREKGKLATMARLEGVLPQHVLMKALT